MGWVNWCDTPLADTIYRALSPGTQSFGSCEDLSGVFGSVRTSRGDLKTSHWLPQTAVCTRVGDLARAGTAPFSHILLHTIKA